MAVPANEAASEESTPEVTTSAVVPRADEARPKAPVQGGRGVECRKSCRSDRRGRRCGVRNARSQTDGGEHQPTTDHGGADHFATSLFDIHVTSLRLLLVPELRPRCESP